MEKESLYNENQIFNKQDLEKILNKVVGKTLGEVDVNGVFERTINNPKITGIAGDVVEESILGYGSDTKQAPDILVDGVETEVKTTGLRKIKNNPKQFEAKEPMSITAVSPWSIVTESFYQSHFWRKLNQMLIVYYLYDSDKTVTASEYANFPIIDYHFNTFDEEDTKILESDWGKVKNLVEKIHQEFENPREGYPLISSAIRKDLMFIDTAPKYPNNPRFRLKRSYVTSMYQKSIGRKFVELPDEYISYKEIDKKLHELTINHRGKTIRELIDELGIEVRKSKKRDASKMVAETITCKMFGAKASKMSQIELFSELGLKLKTITQTKEGKRTEDTKFHPVDFTEIADENITFEDSIFYRDFAENVFLFIVFQEPNKNSLLLDNKFIGFKRLSLSDEFISKHVRATWEELRYKVIYKRVVEKVVRDKNGNPIINKSGEIRTAINFPKSKDFLVFLRGTGADSTAKTEQVNGIKMYRQNVWIKGSEIVRLLDEEEFI